MPIRNLECSWKVRCISLDFCLPYVIFHAQCCNLWCCSSENILILFHCSVGCSCFFHFYSGCCVNLYLGCELPCISTSALYIRFTVLHKICSTDHNYALNTLGQPNCLLVFIDNSFSSSSGKTLYSVIVIHTISTRDLSSYSKINIFLCIFTNYPKKTVTYLSTAFYRNCFARSQSKWSNC